MTSTRVAAFDCGTNSLRLLIADLDAETGEMNELVREMRIVRVGQGVDRTGRIAEESMVRAFAALDEYAALVAEHRPTAMRFCATSAARDAANAAEFMDGVSQRLGVEPEVIDGDAEARASFAGATRVLGEVDGPVLVLDIGGGSTELILGDNHGGRAASAEDGGRSASAEDGGRAASAEDGGRAASAEDGGRAASAEDGGRAASASERSVETRSVETRSVETRSVETPSVSVAHSLDIGSVRLTERHLHDDPPTAEQVAALCKDVDEALDGCRVDPSLARTVVGVAGSVTTVAAAALGLPAYDRERIHLARLRTEVVHAAVAELVAMSVAERRELGYMHPGRADVIAAGALILDRVLLRTPVEHLIVSESDILDGIAWSLT